MKLKLLPFAFLMFMASQVKAGAIVPAQLRTYIQLSGLGTSTTAFQAQVNAAVSHGFGNIDINMDQWALLEPSSGSYSASALADLLFKVNLATAAGLTINMQLPINNSNGWLPIAFSTPVTDPYFGAIGYTHYVTSDSGKMYWIARKIAERIGISTKVNYRSWNEPDLKYSLCDSTAASPARVSTYIRIITNHRQGVFDALAPSTPSFHMAGISQPNGYGTLWGYTTFYTPTGSWGREAIAQGLGNMTDTWDMHCYGDASCTMDMIASTVAFWNADYGSTKPVVIGEANTFGGTYPGPAESEERRKSVWFSTAVPQALGTYGFSVFSSQTLYGNDQGMMDSNLVDRISGTAWLSLMEVLGGKSFERDRNSGALTVSEWRDPTSGRKSWRVNSTLGSPTVQFHGPPIRSDIYDTYGNLLYSNASPSTLFSILASSQSILVEELTPPGAFSGRE